MAVHLGILQWISWSDTHRTDRIMKSEGIRLQCRYFKGCGLHRDIHSVFLGDFFYISLLHSHYSLLFIFYPLNMPRLDEVEKRAWQSADFYLGMILNSNSPRWNNHILPYIYIIYIYNKFLFYHHGARWTNWLTDKLTLIWAGSHCNSEEAIVILHGPHVSKTLTETSQCLHWCQSNGTCS